MGWLRPSHLFLDIILERKTTDSADTEMQFIITPLRNTAVIVFGRYSTINQYFETIRSVSGDPCNKFHTILNLLQRTLELNYNAKQEKGLSIDRPF